ncbi:MAG TPA: hypothetical protein VI877_01725, partial [Dehalococcoidia bacterium]|nr:hypothetical protein [Dehalococcoidia bacterium]
RVIARLDRPPDWTRRDNTYKTAPPDNLADFGDFVYAVVNRYKGKIQHYQIWNEPNIWPEWGDRPTDPDGYAELLKVAYQRAKAADPNALILSAPLAQTLETGPRNLNELDYLEAMYRAGARDYFDIIMANAYGFDRPPPDPPHPQVLNFNRVQLLREAMVKNGDGSKGVWLNEFGWNAAPADFPPEKLFWRRVEETQQAAYTAEAISMARTWGWLGVINIWYFRQVGDILPNQADYYFRVVDTDFTPRLVYYRLQELAQSFHWAGPDLHQETSPALSLTGNWQFRINPLASGNGAAASSSPGDEAIFSFVGTGVSLQHNGGRGRLYVELDGRGAGLKQRDDGGSFVELGP